MPMAIPLIIAAAEAYAGAAAMAAAVSVGAEIMAGAMIAGAAMTAVGTLTGNQKLTKIGGIVGAVGSLGTAAYGLANVAASAGTVADAGASAAPGIVESAAPATVDAGAAASATTSTIPTFAADGTQVGTMGGAVANGAAGAGSAGTGLVDSSITATPNPVQPLVPDAASSVGTTGAANPAAPDALAGGENTSLANPSVQSPTTTAPTANTNTLDAGQTQNLGTQRVTTQSSFGGAGSDPAATGYNQTGSALDASKTVQPATTTSPGFQWSDVNGFMKNNAQLINTGAGIVNGAMKNASDRNNLKTQAELAANAAQAARDRYNQSLVGLQTPTYRKG